MTESMQCLFAIFAFVLFIVAGCFGLDVQRQLASFGFCLAGGAALVAAAIMAKNSK